MQYTPHSVSHKRGTHHDRAGLYPTAYGYACGYVCNIDWIGRLGTKPMAQVFQEHGVYFVKCKDVTGIAPIYPLASKYQVDAVIKWLYQGINQSQKGNG